MSSLPRYVILDFETTGLDPTQSEIIEIGAILVEGTRALERFHRLVRPDGALPRQISKLTGITPEMLAEERRLPEVLPEFVEFLGDHRIVAHNSSLEKAFLDAHVAPHVDAREFRVENSIEPMALLLPDQPSHSMESLRAWAGIVTENAHRADQDCEDLLALLVHARGWMRAERPWLMRVVRERLGPEGFAQPWWWSWYFSPAGDAVAGAALDYPKREPIGDLRELKARASGQEVRWKDAIPPEALESSLRNETSGFGYRESQARMARTVAAALNGGGKVAIEAPTGTGKSLAYLLPGILAARASGAPLVVSTHSKSLQDQLLEKDLPLAREILGEASVKASSVKGQENYLCLRKLHDLLGSVGEETPLEERWAAAYLFAFAAVSRTAELDRVSHYLRRQIEPLPKLVDQVRSHYTTTLGPTCPFYRTCHFFDSARLAHQSDVIVANHSLVFHWPTHLPEIRTVVFDEAHHLEDQITEAYSVKLAEAELADSLDRLSRKHGARRAGDTTQIARLLARILPEERPEPGERIGELTDAVRTRLMSLRSVIPLSLAEPREGSEGYDEIINLSLAPENPRARTALLEALANLAGSIESLRDFLARAVEACEDERIRDDRAADLLRMHAARFESYGERVRQLLGPALQEAFPAGMAAPVVPTVASPDRQPARSAGPSGAPAEAKAPGPDRDFLRLLYWSGRENVWRFSVAPIEVAALAQPFFESKHAVVATSATLSAGQNEEFIVRRVGLGLSKPFVSLPSPYRLEEQAAAFIPSDVAQPGTPSHLEALIDFTGSVAAALGGKTLLLVTSNRRLKIAADALRERLAGHGIEVFDSLSDRRAAEAFKSAERALLIGSERYGEGLDIPGPRLSCVIIEKINEAMTRSPLAEARKARTKFALFDYDFPVRMMWLKQRVGRLIRSASDSGSVVIFDPRYHRWGASSKAVVNRALAPIPILGGTREQVVRWIEERFSQGSDRESS